MRRLLFALIIAPLALAGWGPTPTAAAENLPQRQIDGFALPDYRGRVWTMAELAGGGPLVVAFVGVDCPLARLYGPRLQELADQYAAQGVQFVGIDSNRQDSIEKLAHYARTRNVKFPLLKDAGNVVADQFGVERNPAVYLLDAQGKIRYEGRIDDQYGLGESTGYARADIRRRHLAEALDQLLAGQEIQVTHTDAVGCIIGRVRPTDENSDVTYSNQIARIFQRNCVECHREGEIGPFTMESYEDVAGWGEMISEVVRENRMPPWHADPAHGEFLNAAGLTEDQREQIHQWVKAGCPEGDPSQLPEPVSYAAGWRLGEPDETFFIADEPFTVPAEGVVEYRYFVVDPGYKEDRWVSAAEIRPGTTSVVHHVILYLAEGDIIQALNDGAATAKPLAIMVPGGLPMSCPPGMGKKIPAGAKLVFQMHYTPNGREEPDLTSVGLHFIDADQVQTEVVTKKSANIFLEIPPHAENYEVTSGRSIRDDELLISLFPHTHVRGTAFSYEIQYPDGTKEVLLDVPHYDFNWQNTYILAEPKLLPKGSRLRCVAHYDNSENNLANPDPSATVTWGHQTWEEMMIGFYDVALVGENPSDE